MRSKRQSEPLTESRLSLLCALCVFVVSQDLNSYTSLVRIPRVAGTGGRKIGRADPSEVTSQAGTHPALKGLDNGSCCEHQGSG
jgi:hypothetical protein